MKPKLLLINPWIYDFTAYDLWSKPLGLLYLGSFLRSRGFDVHLIDCLDKYEGTDNQGRKIRKYGVGPYQRKVIDKPDVLKDVPRRYARYGISEESFISQLRRQEDVAAVLLTSIMTYWYPGVQRTARLVREHLPGIPLILGGIYATLLPDHARKHIQPDYLITGPGEIKTLRLLSELLQIPLNDADLPQDLDAYPYPAFDLLSHNDYLILMTARGCPYDCSFCVQKKISMPFTQRKPKAVTQEIREQYERYRLRDFAFYDDALFINSKTHINVILEEVIDSGLPLRFHSPNGLFARFIDTDLARLMFESNFKTIRLSFETSNEERRKDMFSKVSNAHMIEAVENLVTAGYRSKDIEAYVMMGLPDQSIEEVVASILFVHNLGVQIRLASFSPIPGTIEFQRAIQSGRIMDDIDPLLTNKSIFPLSSGQSQYQTFRKLRTFANVLNEAVRRNLSLFADPDLGSAVKSIVRQMV